MQEWKANQINHHLLATDHTDDLNKVDVVMRPDTVVADALRHFNEYVEEWIYPAKSYAVAICYANWLSEDFGEGFYNVLDDPDLLYGNDPHFVPYSKDPETYDLILSQLKWKDDKGMVPDIYEYYKAEMLNGL